MGSVLLTFAIPEGTGASRMLLEYGGALADAGHTVTLAHGDSTANSPTLPEAGKRVLEKLQAKNVQCIPCTGFREPFSRRLLTDLGNIADKEKSEVVIGFQQLDRKYALGLARRRGIPCVITALNKHTFWGPKPVAWAKRFLYSRLLRSRGSLIICSSQEIENELKREFKIPPSRLALIPNGLEMPEALLSEEVGFRVREELGLSDQACVMINIARIDVQKGQDLLIEALGELQADRLIDSEWSLLLVGDVSSGPNAGRMREYQSQLLSRVEELGLSEKIKFLGWRDDLRELLTASDFYIHPSRWEGWPLANLHAMAEAKPIATSDCVESPLGFVEGEHGYTFASDEIEPLKKAILGMLGATDLRRMGQACRSLARKHYDSQVLNSQFVASVESLLHNDASKNG